MNKLTKRQQCIVDFANILPVTVDVGCDHGYIGVQLLLDNKTNHLIASDISAPSLEKTNKLLKQNNLLDKSSTRVGDGLDIIQPTEKIDQVIIAGMGGKEMMDILERYPNKSSIKHWIFQPMKEVSNLRNYMQKNNLKILHDVVIKDKDKFYHIITAKYGQQKLSTIQRDFGAVAKDRNTDYFEWLKQKQRKVQKILKNIPENNEKIVLFKQCLKNIEKIK